MDRCATCSAALTGPFCSQCGERRLEPDALTLRHFMAHTVAPELFQVDGSFWRTLRLLFLRPGQLTLEYAAGRRRPYLNPFKLLLIAIVLFALMSLPRMNWKLGPVTMSITPAALSRGRSVDGTVVQADPYGLLRGRVEAKRSDLSTDAARQRFHDRMSAFVQPVSFTNVLLLAASLHVFFRWKRRRFLEHVAFSMHVASFALLSSVVLFAAYHLRHWLGGYFLLTIALVSLWHFAYLAVAVRRFYLADTRWRWLTATLAALLLYVLNSAFMMAVHLAGAAIALAMA